MCNLPCFLVLSTVKSLLPSPPVAPVSCMVGTAMYIAVPYKADVDLTTVLTFLFFQISQSYSGQVFFKCLAILVILMKIILYQKNK